MKRFTLITLVTFAAGLAACSHGQNQAADNSNAITGNPSNGNLAPVNQPAAQPQQTPPVAASGQSYAAPPPSDSDNATDYAENSDYQQPVEATEPPPPLPEYAQPPAPGDDYVWTPGYWAYASGGYYWVPGAWVLAPYVDALWTPPWWGFDNGVYVFNAGYWAPYIGYYGGIDYGFGYTGHGYYGGYWNQGHMYYDRAVTNVDPAVVHNVYNRQVPMARRNYVSYNGGRGGIDARPTRQELAVTPSERTAPVRAQVQHEREAVANHGQFAKAGKPASLAAQHPLATTYKAPAARPPAAAARAIERPAAPAQARVQPAQRGPVQATRVPENRPAARPVPENRTEARPVPQSRAEARPAARPAPQARAEARPAARPAPQARAEARPAARPAPQAHAEARPAARPAPQAHAEARPVAPRRQVAQAHPQEHRPAAPARPAPAKREEQKR